jgi:hypothetical protein
MVRYRHPEFDVTRARGVVGLGVSFRSRNALLCSQFVPGAYWLTQNTSSRPRKSPPPSPSLTTFLLHVVDAVVGKKHSKYEYTMFKSLQTIFSSAVEVDSAYESWDPRTTSRDTTSRDTSDDGATFRKPGKRHWEEDKDIDEENGDAGDGDGQDGEEQADEEGEFEEGDFEELDLPEEELDIPEDELDPEPEPKYSIEGLVIRPPPLVHPKSQYKKHQQRAKTETEILADFMVRPRSAR